MPAPRRRALALVALLVTLVAVPAVSSAAAPTSLPAPFGAARPLAPDAAAPAAAALVPIAPPLVLNPDQPGYYGWGYSVSAAGDVNGDGYADFLASNATVSPWGTWAVVLFYGSAAGPVSPPGWVRTTYTHPAQVSAAGDVNDDGYDDVVIGAGSADGVGTGLVEVFHGGAAGLATVPAFAPSGGASFGAAVCTAGDVNADGYDDIVVGEPLAGATAGAATIYFGSALGLTPGLSMVVNGVATNQHAGIDVAGLGDINGDGFDDVGIGAATGSHVTSASLLVLGGSPAPTITSGPGGVQSIHLLPAGDVNGDGYADHWETVPEMESTQGADDYAGAAVLVYGNGGSGYAGVGYGGEQFGIVAFTAGDFNGDGLADAIIGKYDGDVASFQILRGRRGNAGAIPFPALLTLGGSYDHFSARAAGDVNGDGFGDVVAGLPASSDFGAGSGKVLLYSGRADQPTVVTERLGAQDETLAGWSVATGDVNGDGFDDVAVGSPLWDGEDYIDGGRVELYLGGPDGLAASPVWFGRGWQDNDQNGISVSMGQDVNGDGYGDIVAGAHAGDHVHVWLGGPNWATADVAPAWTISGPQPGSYFGASVALAGDVNGDGYADVLVGAPTTETITGGGSALFHHPQAGKVYLYAGSPTGLTGPVWSFSNNQDYGQVGTSVAAAGDVNADGFSDLVFGSGLLDAPGTDQGAAFCFLGASTWPTTTANAIWLGTAAFDYFGQAVAGVGDVDGDGYADIGIGSFNAGGTGKVFVVRGGASGPDAAPAWTLTGGTPGAAFGSSVAPAGDVDGDGYSDVLVGEVFGNGPSLSGCGDAYLFRGGSVLSATAWSSYRGVANGDNLGHVVAGGGDVNGDGFGDLLLGVPRRTTSFFQEGSVRLVYGNTTASTPLVAGHARPTFATRAGPGAAPLAIYGRSRHPNAFGLASQASSAGGRDAVALDWRVVPRVGAGAGVQGRSAWAAMNAPSAALGGARLVTQQVNGLTSGGVYGWRTRVLSRSPWFRYGSWFTPQPNGRASWDVRLIAGVDDVPLAGGAAALELSAPWPNPSSGGVRLDFALPAAARVHAVVRDLQGREVRVLADGPYTAGRHALQWDGADADQRRSAPGIYFVDVESGTEHRTTRVVRLR